MLMHRATQVDEARVHRIVDMVASTLRGLTPPEQAAAIELLVGDLMASASMYADASGLGLASARSRAGRRTVPSARVSALRLIPRAAFDGQG